MKNEAQQRRSSHNVVDSIQILGEPEAMFPGPEAILVAHVCSTAIIDPEIVLTLTSRI